MIAAVLLTLAQPAAAAEALPPPSAPRTLAQDRLDLCMDKARNDPTTAISEASAWDRETGGTESSEAQQCLGIAYTAMLRWQAAERAFLASREAAPAADPFRRAQLAAMAGNAALAEGRGAAAQVALEMAATDATETGDAALQALVQVDLARALVLQGDTARAEAALETARMLDPQSPFAWLLSATLARRQNKLEEARSFIETAATLAPDYAETGLEAGVIAMLSGDEEGARKSWQSVIAVDPSGDEAATARGYLAQIDAPAADTPASEETAR
ncbi:MAG TPA: tetratricopeptide repeat protein [Croceibacterium sp.]|nr:tetratricopeptide repeat protein [Croceibacterium sp.]